MSSITKSNGNVYFTPHNSYNFCKNSELNEIESSVSDGIIKITFQCENCGKVLTDIYKYEFFNRI